MQHKRKVRTWVLRGFELGFVGGWIVESYLTGGYYGLHVGGLFGALIGGVLTALVAAIISTPGSMDEPPVKDDAPTPTHPRGLN